MGNCLSGDIRGGKQAVGGVQGRLTESNNNAGGGGDHNDAVDFFFRSRGLHALFTQIEIVTKQNRTSTLNLHDKRTRVSRNLGTLSVHVEETVASRSAVEISLHCSHLANVDLFSKSDPFLRISRIVESGGCVPICKTEVINDNSNPIWRPITLSMQQYGSKENPLIIECFDFNTSGNHVLLGKIQKSVADMQKLRLEQSGANFVLPSAQRNHEKAIMEVGEVIQFYDSDKRFPAWGFGGKTFNGAVSHCFNLNGIPDGSEVEGVDGIMAAYANALHNVALAGPTLFGPVINMAAQIAGQSLSHDDRSKYFVLLIITDGVLTDLQETKDALVRASDLPLSILIVGVGGADFTQMEILDADNGRRLESSTGRVASRDIVQFVPMREVHSGQISAVQALLEELPGQFLTYGNKNYTGTRYGNRGFTKNGAGNFSKNGENSGVRFGGSAKNVDGNHNKHVAGSHSKSVAGNTNPRSGSDRKLGGEIGRKNSNSIDYRSLKSNLKNGSVVNQSGDCIKQAGNRFEILTDEVEGIMNEGNMQDSAKMPNGKLKGKIVLSEITNAFTCQSSQPGKLDSNITSLDQQVTTSAKGGVDLDSDSVLRQLHNEVQNVDSKGMEVSDDCKILDADNGRLVSSTGRVATRDIVQFVPIRDVHSRRISAVQALLEELPGQFLSYVRAGDIQPCNLQVA
ncbi:hypothetical protein LWI29_033509 [Acer saccharum]|uniref:C2 domain-containing protein n=1 Tax=Acer saccharum TaxID=4024 RepID=A0AA39T7U7_ACESA|nr:hypothetical protein LWI29_033509 [Acer saccharum]